jgi:hypothetical protein
LAWVHVHVDLRLGLGLGAWGFRGTGRWRWADFRGRALLVAAGCLCLVPLPLLLTGTGVALWAYNAHRPFLFLHYASTRTSIMANRPLAIAGPRSPRSRSVKCKVQYGNHLACCMWRLGCLLIVGTLFSPPFCNTKIQIHCVATGHGSSAPLPSCAKSAIFIALSPRE